MTDKDLDIVLHAAKAVSLAQAQHKKYVDDVFNDMYESLDVKIPCRRIIEDRRKII